MQHLQIQPFVLRQSPLLYRHRRMSRDGFGALWSERRWTLLRAMAEVPCRIHVAILKEYFNESNVYVYSSLDL